MIRRLRSFLRRLGGKLFGVVPIARVRPPIPPQPTSFWLTPIAEIDPLGILSQKTHRFNSRYDMVPAARQEIRLRREAACAPANTMAPAGRSRHVCLPRQT